ncbi:SWIM zinc finger family protein [Chitinophaga sp. GbtcB8]|uniref:SWIM zinc finger family protein n=1 Tax=Chitinophaga sp. GbtcB8 TaxID=2824753 RepID=UPI001C300942|nr:SWIM zinc finger family protein [Chitinophaga sp. GbtcB8]
MQLTEEQILALAPDESSKKSGKDLANPAKWVTKGVNEAALWGECQGSGSKPYQTQVGLVNMAFKCSCPSRKFPCKHGLGLLLLHARHTTTFTDHETPAWVAEWLDKRTKRDEKKVEKESKPVDEAAQAKRKEAREQGVEDGITELLLWVKDIVRNGILNIPEKGPAFFEGMAKRMVDAKAPGLAGMVRALGDTDFYVEGWQSYFMDQLLRIYLVIAGFNNRASLPGPLAEDIRSWIGFTQNQEALKTQTGITDTWLVLGKQTIDEDNLLVERNWLYGTGTNQYALVLQFSVRGQGITFSFSPGMSVEAELVFYPSAQPMRAIIKRQLSTSTIPPYQVFNNWQQVAAAETVAYAALPFSTERPFILAQITPVQYAGRWWLADDQQQLVQLKDNYKHLYTLLALSGGQPLNMAVLGKENVYEPLGVWNGAHYINISN